MFWICWTFNYPGLHYCISSFVFDLSITGPAVTKSEGKVKRATKTFNLFCNITAKQVE